MPAVSKSQQKLFAQALSYKRGNRKTASKRVKELAKNNSVKTLRDFAETDRKNLPDKKK